MDMWAASKGKLAMGAPPPSATAQVRSLARNVKMAVPDKGKPRSPFRSFPTAPPPPVSDGQRIVGVVCTAPLPTPWFVRAATVQIMLCMQVASEDALRQASFLKEVHPQGVL